MSPVPKRDGKSAKDDRSRDPLVCCQMHLLSLRACPDNVRRSFSTFFLLLFGRTIQEDNGQSEYEVSLSCGEMILIPREFLVAS